MATAKPTTACPLCLENYVDPRKLPSCTHTFCKSCLITHITKLQDNKELQNGLPCPLCRTISPAPQDADKPAEWVSSLEKVTIKLERNERSKQDRICASCHAQGKSSQADMYCFNCLEKLCGSCLLTRHTYIPIKDHKYIKVGEAFGGNGEEEILHLLSENISCSYHPDKPVEFLCKDDEEFCCSKCIVVKHRKCSHVLEVDVLAKQDQSIGDDQEHVKEIISRLESYANDSIKTMKACLVANKTQVDAIIGTLQDVREKINALLDALENNCHDQSKAAAKRKSLKINEDIDKLKTAIEYLRGYKNLIDKANKYCSSSHQYVSAKMLKIKLRDLESSILDIASSFQSSNISLTQEHVLVDLLNIATNDTAILASITESPAEPVPKAYGSSTLLRNYNVSKVAASVVQKNYQDVYAPLFSSLAFLPTNNIVLVDDGIDAGYCLLATSDGKLVANCDFLSSGVPKDKRAYCATVTKTGMVAVSLPELKKFAFISPDDKLKITHTIDTKYKPRAICGLRHGDLAVAWSYPVAFGIISADEVPVEKVYFCQDKSGRRLKNFEYMAVDARRSHVIQPCQQDKAVYCFDLEGHPKFKYTSTELRNPRGVALDRDGNIYVCDYSANAIHVISATGGGIRVVTEGCYSYPTAIAFKKDGEEFAVTNRRQKTVTFFRVQKA